MQRAGLIFVLPAVAVAAWFGTNGQLNGQDKADMSNPIECALVENATDNIGERGYYQDQCPPDPEGKDWRWLPVVRNDVTHDPNTEIKEGPTVDVQPTQVVLTWTKRPKTAEELDSTKQAQIDSLQPPVKDALCDHYSSISALEGAGSKTTAQCDEWLKGFLQ